MEKKHVDYQFDRQPLYSCSRRSFLRWGVGVAVAGPWALSHALEAESPSRPVSAEHLANAKAAISTSLSCSAHTRRCAI